METQTEKAAIREYLIQELPLILEEEPAVRKTVIRIFRNRFADRDVTEDRFERLFQELKEDRAESRKKMGRAEQEMGGLEQEMGGRSEGKP